MINLASIMLSQQTNVSLASPSPPNYKRAHTHTHTHTECFVFWELACLPQENCHQRPLLPSEEGDRSAAREVGREADVTFWFYLWTDRSQAVSNLMGEPWPAGHQLLRHRGQQIHINSWMLSMSRTTAKLFLTNQALWLSLMWQRHIQHDKEEYLFSKVPQRISSHMHWELTGVTSLWPRP